MFYHCRLCKYTGLCKLSGTEKEFHKAKYLDLISNVESGELLEPFLWNKDVKVNVEKVVKELADVFIFTFFMAGKNIFFNVEEIILDKMMDN